MCMTSEDLRNVLFEIVLTRQHILDCSLETDYYSVIFVKAHVFSHIKDVRAQISFKLSFTALIQ